MLLNRLCSGSIVLLLVGLLHWGVSNPLEREKWLYLFALPLGYGHLIGGLIFARGRLLRGLGFDRSVLASMFASSVMLTLLAVYTWALQSQWLGSVVIAGFLVLSAWHIAENDLAMARAYRSSMSLGRLMSSAVHRVKIMGSMAGLLLLALVTPEAHALFGDAAPENLPMTLMTVSDLAAAVLLYHACTWIVFFLHRARGSQPREARRIRLRLFWVHFVPLAVHAGCYYWVEALFIYISMPTLYLFWSAAHAIQTAAVRGRATALRARAATG